MAADTVRASWSEYVELPDDERPGLVAAIRSGDLVIGLAILEETLDAFIDAMIEIAEIAESDPDAIAACPTTTVVGQLDETRAARKPDLASLAPKTE